MSPPPPAACHLLLLYPVHTLLHLLLSYCNVNSKKNMKIVSNIILMAPSSSSLPSYGCANLKPGIASWVTAFTAHRSACFHPPMIPSYNACTPQNTQNTKRTKQNTKHTTQNMQNTKHTTHHTNHTKHAEHTAQHTPHRTHHTEHTT